MEKKYTESDLSKAFQAGVKRGEFLERDEFAPFDVPLDEYEYIKSLNESVEEEKIPFTYYLLRHKLEWKQFCDLTGIDYYAKSNGFEIKDAEIFYLTESQAKKHNLL